MSDSSRIEDGQSQGVIRFTRSVAHMAIAKLCSHDDTLGYALLSVSGVVLPVGADTEASPEPPVLEVALSLLVQDLYRRFGGLEKAHSLVAAVAKTLPTPVHEGMRHLSDCEL